MPRRKNIEDQENVRNIRRRTNEEDREEEEGGFEEENVEKPVAKTPGRKKAKQSAESPDNFYSGLAHEVEEEGSEEYSSGDLELPTKTNFDAGQIRKIYVENFMCHRKFSIDLGEGLNFIVGKNGSGKSAVAAAIQLCLGATARNTGRGSSLVNLIREGSTDPAVIRVTMVNTGPDAYKPEEYGDTITVERKINRTGGVSGYSIKNDKMKEVSNQKSELESILRTFNIFVDNPCCILTQDESKKFIQGKSQEKYDFFLKATGLYALREELKDISDNVLAASELLAQNEAKLQGKKSHVDALKLKYDNLKRLDGLEEAICEFQAKVFWAELGVAQGHVVKFENEFNKMEKLVQDLRAELEKAMGKTGNQAEELQEVEGEISSVTDQIEEVARRGEEKQAAAQQATRQHTQLTQNYTQHDRSLQDMKRRLKNVKDEIKELNEKARQGAGAEEQILYDNIEMIKQAVESRRKEQISLQEQKSDLVNTVQRLRNDKAQHMKHEQNARYELDRLKQEQRNLQNNSSNSRVAIFGNDILSLHNAIERERFRGEVIGPIGSLVNVKDQYSQTWGKALERSIGPILRSFIVTNAEDRERLFSIAASKNIRNIQIITQSVHPRYNVQKGEIPEDALIVMDALIISNDLVFNVLIDQSNIDKVVLVTDAKEMTLKYVAGNIGNQQFRYGISSAIDLHGNSIFYRYGNQGNESNRFPFKNYLAKDSSEVVASLAANIAQKEDDLKAMLAENGPMAAEMNECTRKIDEIDTQLSAINRQFPTLNKDKRNAENRLAEVQEAGRIDTTALEQEKAELENAIDLAETQVEMMASNLKISKEQVKNCQDEKRSVDQEQGELKERLRDLEKRIIDIMRQRTLQENKLHTFKKKIDERENELEGARKKLEKAVEEVEKKKEAAVEQTRKLLKDWDEEEMELRGREQDVAYLGKKIKEARAELEEGKKAAGLTGENIEQVAARYQRALDDYNLAVQTVERVRSNVQHLKEDENTRRTKWVQALKSNTKNVKRKFDAYVQTKGSAGTIQFDHKEGTLTITYQVDNMDESSLRNDVRNLSGGERSFVTFSLLLALGHVIESPFRLMDEYDVFMDEPTRKLTLDILKRYIKQADQCNRQFIILTPHTLGDTAPTRTLHIKKMPEPTRISAHGPQQQTLNYA